MWWTGDGSKFTIIDSNLKKIWLIGFNGLSNRLGLFYAKRLGNGVHCMFILTFFVVFQVFFSWLYDRKYSYRIQIICKQIYLIHRRDSNRNCHSQSECNILTSDPAELSNKKCTCVNNRCIRWKISGDNIDCWRVELCYAHWRRWVSNNYITRWDRKSVSWS